MGVLAAGVTEVADQLGATVEAIFLVGMPVIAFAGLWFDRTPHDPPGDRIAQRFQFTDHQVPRRRHIMRCRGRVLAVRAMARIGLLGGSFNPAHHGHRAISLHALSALGLDEVWWLVSPGNPLKEGAKDMASLEARLASAGRMARRAPIRVSDFEGREGTRYTIDTARKLKQRFPKNRFIWLMGADNLRHFHHWRDWRGLAREVPIAVIRRPGYGRFALAVRVMGWLGRFVRSPSQAKCWTEWSTPAIILLRLPRDPTSATAIRAHDPNWHHREQGRVVRVPRLTLPLSVRRPLDRTSP
jgi:nicotinate-nucleotide adenylyltransferase